MLSRGPIVSWGIQLNFHKREPSGSLFSFWGLEATKRGMRDYKCVHDSYGTHACDMEEFTDIIWEQFCKLYEGDVLTNIYTQLNQNAFDDTGEIPETN